MAVSTDQMGFGIIYAAKIPSGCTLYKVITKAPKGLGNFDRYISAETPKQAKDYWKSHFDYMGNKVKITDVVIVTKEEQEKIDITRCVIGKLERKPELFTL